MSAKVFFFTYILIGGYQSQASRNVLLDLLSGLHQGPSGSKQPIVVVISNDHSREMKRPMLPYMEKKDKDIYSVLHLALDKHQYKQQLTTPSYKLKGTYRAQRDRLDPTGDKAPRSPIVQNLLRFSQTLRCAAQSNCENSCNKKYTGTKKMECNVTCTERYECPEEVDEYVDPCEENQCGSCGSGDCAISTKGVPLEADEPACKRC